MMQIRYVPCKQSLKLHGKIQIPFLSYHLHHTVPQKISTVLDQCNVRNLKGGDFDYHLNLSCP